jgi:predicted Zn-dependent protease
LEIWCWVLVSAALLATACSINPATGNRQFMLVSEQQEIDMGRRAHEEIVESMGVYDDDRVQSYVSELGLELAALSERPHLPWTFTVLDDPVVNAFALPGGFIYVTRGILTHLDSEAELVGVLGHEIGHVTARHGAARMSQSQLASLGLGVGMIVSPELRQYGDLAQQGVALLFLKYSRDDERQADDLGFRYMVHGGWDASALPSVFGVLRQVSEVEGAGRLPSWLATHPDPVARQERIRDAVASTQLDLSGAKVNRSTYLATLDGMTFGENPREGFFEGGTFFHPDLEFQIDFPAGWETQNQRRRVVGASPREDAIVVLGVALEADPPAAAGDFLAQEGIVGGRIQSGRIHGLPAAMADFELPREGQSTIRGQVAFVHHRKVTYRLLGFTMVENWGSFGDVINGFLMSFRQLTDARALGVQPNRLELVTPDRDLSLEAFQQRFPSSVSLRTLAVINHVSEDGTLSGGRSAKRVVGGAGR